MLQQVRGFFTWLLPRLITFYEEMVNNTSGENVISSVAEADCWKVVTQTLKTLFKQERGAGPCQKRHLVRRLELLHGDVPQRGASGATLKEDLMAHG